MASLIFNVSAIQGIIGSQLGSIANANGIFTPPLTAVFGNGTANSNSALCTSLLFVFKGTPPTNFSSFTTVSSRESDILMALPIRYPERITYANATGIRIRVAGTVGSNLTQTSIINAFSSNSVLIANTISPHCFIPGQKVTVTGANTTTSSNINGVTFVIESTPNAYFFTANAANGTIDGNTVVANGNTFGTVVANSVAFRSGVANWFVAARWGNGAETTINTPFTNYGAAIGTISQPNLGGDLQIPSTTITEGTFYTSSGMFVNFPFEWPI